MPDCVAAGLGGARLPTRRGGSAGRGRLRWPGLLPIARRDRPDTAILTGAGFAAEGRREFAAIRRWTADDLAGYQFSTSVLSRARSAAGPRSWRLTCAASCARRRHLAPTART